MLKIFFSSLDDADEAQSKLLNEFLNVKKGKSRIYIEKRKLKTYAIENIDAFHEGRKMVLHVSKSRIFQFQLTEGTGNPGLLTRVAEICNRKFSNQMLQRLAVALA